MASQPWRAAFLFDCLFCNLIKGKRTIQEAYLSASELLRLHRAGGKRFINLFRTIGRCIQRAVQIQFQHPVFLADGGNAALFAVIYSPRGGDGHAAGCKA